MAPKLITAEELPELSPPHKSTELVRGVMVVRELPGARHGYVAQSLAWRIGQHVHERHLGYVFAAETGFKIFSNPDTVRAPDVSFVRAHRLTGPLPAGYLDIAPDLVVEVLSPSDRKRKVAEKVADWLEAGTELVWVIDPEKRAAEVHRPNAPTLVLQHTSVLSAEAILPNFSCPLPEIL
jgi:Uma2 family endonuclease